VPYHAGGAQGRLNKKSTSIALRILYLLGRRWSPDRIEAAHSSGRQGAADLSRPDGDVCWSRRCRFDINQLPKRACWASGVAGALRALHSAPTGKNFTDMSNKYSSVAVGAAAPDFSGTAQDGSKVRLSDFRGRKLALYFYPKDDTPGCTKQACNLRDSYQDLLRAGVAIVGVSTDDQDSHERFADKYKLPFPLLADPEREIVERYGVYGVKSLYGRKYMGTNRTTFLIDEDGIVRHVFKRPKVAEHSQEILKKFGLV